MQLAIDFDIQKIIDEELIETHFQPMVSLRKRRVIGYEALSRGIHPEKASLISPDMLFQSAREQGVVLQLDRVCRKKAIESYSPLHRLNPDHILSINMDITFLDDTMLCSNMLLDMVKQYNIHPGNVMIEIVESCNSQTDLLRSFVNDYKDNGFLIALDDMGRQNFNWDRLFSISPHLLKLDRSLAKDVNKSFYRQEVSRSIVNLGHKTGAVIVAEGIENSDDAAHLLELGVDVLQGFYFAEPVPAADIPVESLHETIEEVAHDFREHTLKKIQRKRETFRFLDHITAEIKNELTNCYTAELDETLTELLAGFTEINCGYILDSKGVQITRTVMNPGFSAPATNRLFRPAETGEDLSFKDYYYFINAGMNKYTTGPYISTATGELCTTMSTSFASVEGDTFILCIDYHTDY